MIDMEKYKEPKRIKLGEGLMLETATTTPDGKTLYLACSTNNSVYAIDGMTDSYTQIQNVGLRPGLLRLLAATVIATSDG